MRLRPLISLVLLLALLALAAKPARSLWQWMMTNRAIYALNRGDLPDARQRLEKIRQLDPDNTRAAIYLARIAVQQDQTTRALALLTSGEGASAALYRGIALFKQDQGDAAISQWKVAASSPDRRLLALDQEVFLRLVDALQTTEPEVLAESPGFKDLQLQGIYQSLAGRELFQRGLWVSAQRSLESARRVGIEILLTRVLLSSTYAMLGNVPEAERLVDHAEDPAEFLDFMRRELSRLESKLVVPTVDLGAQADQYRQYVSVLRAKTWALSKSLQLGAAADKPVIAAEPWNPEGGLPTSDPIIRFYAADCLDYAGEPSEAYKLLTGTDGTSANLALELRKLSLAGEIGEVPALCRRFAQLTAEAGFVEAEAIGTSAPLHPLGYRSLPAGSAATALLDLPEKGSYRAYVVAATPRTGGRGTLVKITVENTEHPLYVAKEYWFAYPVPVESEGSPVKITLDIVDKDVDSSAGTGLFLYGIYWEADHRSDG